MFSFMKLLIALSMVLAIVQAAPLPIARIQKRQGISATAAQQAARPTSTTFALGVPTFVIPTTITQSSAIPTSTTSVNPKPTNPTTVSPATKAPANRAANVDSPLIPVSSGNLETATTTQASPSNTQTAQSTNNTNQSSGNSSSSKLWGLTYSPYNTDGSCPSYDKVVSDLKTISAVTSRIRLYSTDCDQLENVVKAITESNLPLEVYAGVWISSGAARGQKEVNDVIHVAKTYGSSSIKGVSVGNEEIFKGTTSEDDLISAINSARSALSSAGLSGIPVYTTDTDANFTKKMADACDLVQVNIYTVFDSTYSSIEDSVQSVISRVNNVKSNIAGGKLVRIGETGYPTAGTSGSQSGSLSAQLDFANGIVCKLGSANIQYFYFEAKDALWKADESALERSFGVYTSDFKQKLDLSKLGKC